MVGANAAHTALGLSPQAAVTLGSTLTLTLILTLTRTLTLTLTQTR